MLKTTDFSFAFQTIGILQVWGVTPFPWSEVSHRPVPVTAATAAAGGDTVLPSGCGGAAQERWRGIIYRDRGNGSKLTE